MLDFTPLLTTAANHTKPQSIQSLLFPFHAIRQSHALRESFHYPVASTIDEVGIFSLLPDICFFMFLLRSENVETPYYYNKNWKKYGIKPRRVLYWQARFVLLQGNAPLFDASCMHVEFDNVRISASETSHVEVSNLWANILPKKFLESKS